MLYKNLRKLYIALIILAAASCKTNSVDLLVINAKIYTVDSLFTVTEAMAIKDGKIVETGSTKDLSQKYEALNTLDAAGKTILPGLIDAHAHFVGLGANLNQCQLQGTESWTAVTERLKAFAQTHPEGWLIGRGWDQNDWPEKVFPDKSSLDSLFPQRPVIITRIDGHAAIANEAALKLAGIEAGETLVGGQIATKNGQLTGLLVDNAVDLVQNVIPAATETMQKRYLLDAEKHCFGYGLTSVHDCGLDTSDVMRIQQLYASKELKIRLNILLSDKAENYSWAFKNGQIINENLRVASFKLYADGALGSRGACLLKPYADEPGHYGFLLKDKAYYDSILPIIYAEGWQACTHAIGDSANRTILQIYNRIVSRQSDHRWRIEHAQVLSPVDFDMFGKGGIVASVQPTHATSDMYWAGDRLGSQRVAGAYAYQQLLQQNGWLPLGTDFPVEDVSPFKTFYAAVLRQDDSRYPAEGYQIANALTREQALRGMTIWAAKAAFEEKIKGSLEAGKLADFIIIDQDLMTAPASALLQINVLKTVLGGVVVFEKN